MLNPKGLSICMCRSPLKLISAETAKEMPLEPSNVAFPDTRRDMGSSKRAADATRAERKAKKRKLEEAIPDLPGEEVRVEKSSKKRKQGKEGDALEEKALKKEKKEKHKRKIEIEKADSEEKEGEKVTTAAKQALKTEKALEAEQAVYENGVAAEGSAEQAPKKSKKERKAERRAKEAAEAAANGIETKTKDVTEPASGVKTNDNAAKEKQSKKTNRDLPEQGKQNAAVATEGSHGEVKAVARFICFIGSSPSSSQHWLSNSLFVTGNLPFSATRESLQKHFTSVKPKEIRLLTKKDKPTESRGCAFVEFDGYDHMKTCLKIFHHSMFNDGVSPPRKINVELT